MLVNEITWAWAIVGLCVVGIVWAIWSYAKSKKPKKRGRPRKK